MEFHENLIVEFSHEVATTKKLIAAIPDGIDWEFKPSEKSMNFSKLAGHVVDMFGNWAKITLTQDELDMKPEEYKPFLPTSKAELLEKLEKGAEAARGILEGFNPEDWKRDWKLTSKGQTFVEQSKYLTWRTMVMNHIIHHRGQMSVYMRHFGAKLPGIYGPSADGF